MIKKFNKYKKLIIFGTLIAPIILILFALVLINYLSIHLTSNNPIININPKIEVSSVDALSLYLSILGILIGAYLTIGIFAFQMQEQEEKIKSVMDYYQTEILKSLNMVFHEKYANISIELSHWIEMSSQVKERLNEDDFEVLNDLCVKLSNSKKLKDNFFINEFLNDFYIYFNEIIRKDNFTVSSFLNLKTVTALNSLGNKKIVFLGVKTDNDNKEFYKIESVDGEYMYVSTQNSINCNCSFKDGYPFSGYIQEIGEKYYKGNINAGEREGKGKIVKSGHVLEDGDYVNGKLFNGKIYGKKIRRNSLSPYNDFFIGTQLYDDLEEYDGGDKEVVTKVVEIADYNVVNGKEILIEDSIRELKVYDAIGNLGKRIIC